MINATTFFFALAIKEVKNKKTEIFYKKKFAKNFNFLYPSFIPLRSNLNPLIIWCSVP